MRWVAALTITVLLASVQCLFACTLSSCLLSAATTSDPPCHRHHKSPVQTSNLCDHQNAVKAGSGELELAQPAVMPSGAITPARLLTASTMLPDPAGVESPPGLRAFSVLRI